MNDGGRTDIAAGLEIAEGLGKPMEGWELGPGVELGRAMLQ
jgi:hypothetical protein